VKAPVGLHKSLEPATLVDVSKRPQRRMSPDATRIGPENDDFDVVSHAPEDRGGVESQRAAIRSHSIGMRPSRSGDSSPAHSSAGGSEAASRLAPGRIVRTCSGRNAVRADNVFRAAIADADDVAGAEVRLTFPGERIRFHASAEAPP
jgi:hypothetical protein